MKQPQNVPQSFQKNSKTMHPESLEAMLQLFFHWVRGTGHQRSRYWRTPKVHTRCWSTCCHGHLEVTFQKNIGLLLGHLIVESYLATWHGPGFAEHFPWYPYKILCYPFNSQIRGSQSSSKMATIGWQATLRWINTSTQKTRILISIQLLSKKKIPQKLS